MFKQITIFAICVLTITGCGNDIECQPDSTYYKLFENGGRPSNKEAMDHMICRDSNGNPI